MPSFTQRRTTSHTTRRYASQSHRPRIGGSQWLTLAIACLIVVWVAIGGIAARNAYDAAVGSQYSDRLTPDGVLSAIKATRASGAVPVVIFWGDGCKHCAAEMQALKKLSEEHPGELMLLGMETWKDDGSAAVRDDVERALGLDTGKVPLLIVGGRVFQGYDEDSPNDADIADAIDETYGDTDRARLATQLLGDAIADNGSASDGGSDAGD